MRFRQLGNTGLFVSELSLGTMTLGEADPTSMFHGIGCPKEEAFKIMDYALGSGINLLDTANVYGQDGMVEKLLGEYLTLRKNRKNLILGTKFRFSMGALPHQSGASRRHIMLAVEDSLSRLKTDYLDLYQVHMEDSNTPEEETLRALDDLIRQGKVRYIGASNYRAFRFLDAHYTSTLNGLNRYCSLQMQYHLLAREIEKEHVPICVNHGMGLLVWSPLAGGFLSGKYSSGNVEEGTRFSVRKDLASRLDEKTGHKVVQALKQISLETNSTPSQVALAWILKKPGVSSVIIGAKKLMQLKENLGCINVVLSTQQMKMLDEMSSFPPVYPYDFIQSKQKKY